MKDIQDERLDRLLFSITRKRAPEELLPKIIEALPREARRGKAARRSKVLPLGETALSLLYGSAAVAILVYFFLTPVNSVLLTKWVGGLHVDRLFSGWILAIAVGVLLVYAGTEVLFHFVLEERKS